MSNAPVAQYRFKNRPFYEVAGDRELNALSSEDAALVAGFAASGYATFSTGIADHVLESAARYMRDTCFDDRGSLTRKRLTNAWRESAAIRQIACDPGIMAKLNVLYGRRPIPFQTLNFPVGTEQRTHSDGIHFNSVPSRFMCGLWVALEDISEASGPLHYYPGSHRLADVDIYDTFDGNESDGAFPALDDYANCYEDFIHASLERAGLACEQVLIKRGDAFVWSAGLCHGGSLRTDPKCTRLSQVVHYFFDDCVYYSPRRSHPQLGRLWLRKIRDIGSDKDVAHVFAGKRFHISAAGPYCFDETAAPTNVATLPRHTRWLRAMRGVVKSLLVR